MAATHRSHLACLLCVSVLLVSAGSPDAAHRAASPRQVPLRLDEARVEAYLGQFNPLLGVHERQRIAAAVVRYSAKYALDTSLVLAVMVQESSARPWARSSKGAMGLMQVMPYMLGVLPVAGNAASIETNVEAGCIILADNIRRLGEERGILAYFWGNEIRGVAYLERVRAARAAILSRPAA